jgi:hypothetical protein
MRRACTLLTAVMLAIAVMEGAQAPADAVELPGLLERVAASVIRYYARAQSIMCIETVRLQSLGSDLLSDLSPARRLDYELRVAWDPAEAGGKPDASVVRDILRINGRPPRPKDEPQCMDPKDISPEPLAIFLPENQKDMIFTLAGRSKVNGRAAVMIDYKWREAGPITTSWSAKDCFSISLPGRTRGRVWVDLETDDVLRFDERLSGMFDATLPKHPRKPNVPGYVTVDRLDSSIVYKAVEFSDPEERVMLPASISTVTVIRNAGTPRLRTTQAFSNYQRFITGGRIVTLEAAENP